MFLFPKLLMLWHVVSSFCSREINELSNFKIIINFPPTLCGGHDLRASISPRKRNKPLNARHSYSISLVKYAEEDGEGRNSRRRPRLTQSMICLFLILFSPNNILLESCSFRDSSATTATNRLLAWIDTVKSPLDALVVGSHFGS